MMFWQRSQEQSEVTGSNEECLHSLGVQFGVLRPKDRVTLLSPSSGSESNYTNISEKLGTAVRPILCISPDTGVV